MKFPGKRPFALPLLLWSLPLLVCGHSDRGTTFRLVDQRFETALVEACNRH